LEGIGLGSVGTIQIKSNKFRVLRDADFQKLVGLASEVHRLKMGVTIVIQAARVVAKHRDNDAIELLCRSASMLSESSLLPEREGHDSFRITPEEALAYSGDDDLKGIRAADIPRPNIAR
jgi:hypothetical protein